jgi:hypothetical protein
MNKTWIPYKTNESKEEPKQTTSNDELNYDEMNIMNNTKPTKNWWRTSYIFLQITSFQKYLVSLNYLSTLK